METVNETIKQAFGPGFDNLNIELNEDKGSAIIKVIDMMKHKLPTMEAAYFLGSLNTDANTLYFLIITANTEKRDGFVLNSMLEESCRSITQVNAFVHNAGNVFGAAVKGNYFFGSILRNSKLVYLSGNLMLPVPAMIGYASFAQKSAMVWERWQGMSRDFLNGARYHMEQGAGRVALFCLHQSAECMLKAVNRAMTGYRIDVHNLSRLLTISTLYTNKFKALTDGEEELAAFNLLKQAYSETRYKDDFQVQPEQVSACCAYVIRLREVAEGLYREHLNRLDNVI